MLQRLSKKAKIFGSAAILCAATAGALTGAPRSGEAWGWWGLLDSANYWSPTSISWADTANPGHYFYGDLSHQGGQVYDYTRILKSVLFAGTFENILQVISEQFGIDILNRKPLDVATMEQSGHTVIYKGQTVPVLYASIKANTLQGSPDFHTFTESIAHHEMDCDRIKQRQ
mgnify:FL=1